MSIYNATRRYALRSCSHLAKNICKRNLVSSLVKEVNSLNSDERKKLMFDKMLAKKRDQLNFLTFEIWFQLHDTTIHLRSWNDKDLFHVSTEDYFGFKKNMGHIPPDAEATDKGKSELAAEMVTWALRFLKKQKVEQCIFITKGYTDVRQRCMSIVWDEMQVVHYLDISRIVFYKGDRRRKPRRLKRNFRPKSVYPMGNH